MRQSAGALVALLALVYPAVASATPEKTPLSNIPETRAVSTLPSCTTDHQGYEFSVRDALAPVAGDEVVGGGATKASVKCLAGDWLVIGAGVGGGGGNDGDNGTGILPESAPSLAIVLFDADGDATYEETLRVDPNTKALIAAGLVIAANPNDDTSGISFGLNAVPSGTAKTCATVSSHGNATSAGTGKFTLTELGAGDGPPYIEACANNVPAPQFHDVKLGTSSFATSSDAVVCLPVGHGSTYTPETASAAGNGIFVNSGSQSLSVRLQSITVTWGDTTGWSGASDEKIYLDIFRAPVGAVTGWDGTTGARPAHYVTGSRITVELDGDSGTVTDAVDQKGGAVIDGDEYPIAFKSLETVALDVSTIDTSYLHVCATRADADFTADAGTPQTMPLNVQLKGWW